MYVLFCKNYSVIFCENLAKAWRKKAFEKLGDLNYKLIMSELADIT